MKVLITGATGFLGKHVLVFSWTIPVSARFTFLPGISRRTQPPR